MATTHPIKRKEELEALKDYYLTQKPNLRNYALIVTGVNTALRISDILELKWKDVYDFDHEEFRHQIILREQKTHKENCIAANRNIVNGLSRYKESLPPVSPSQYVFSGRDKGTALSRSQAYRIIKQASKMLRLQGNISCHSLRKTCGYHAWAGGANPTTLMVIYNHSSFQITKRYLGIDQEDKDQVFLNLNL